METDEADDRPMRIAMVAPPWCEVPPAGYGGLEQVLAYLVDALVDRGHDVTLFGAGERSTTKARFVSTGPIQYDHMNWALPELDHVARINEMLDRGRFDVVHDHTNVGPLTAALRRAPTVVTVHNLPRGQLASYLSRLDRRVALVAISYAQRRLAPHLPWSAVVHHGIPVPGTSRSAPGDGPALWLARFCADKAPELAIEACRAAGVPLVLAGKCQEPGEQRYLAEVVRPMLHDGVELVVNAERKVTADLTARARALILPLRWEEPFGMVLIEAMAAGTPVVALRRGAVPEVVVDGVTGFVRDDPGALAQALGRIGEIDPQACVAHVRERFSPAQMARGYEHVYRWARRRVAPIDPLAPLDPRAALGAPLFDPAVLAVTGPSPASRPARPTSPA
ncbi:glycosyl transferase [Pilimelia terevasa]|uniref:Glycosyl transferase n=1 Tax=Pilimelia terevasa TaxID=53372 RepID=A0A8J3FL66_9ACTN|nr:glycosyltransferase family 4 protein [Pilimelia terevasa]GGK38544.1 glycosyl transferase [Pilimelia terevasa]